MSNIVVVTTWQYAAMLAQMDPATIKARINCARQMAQIAAADGITVTGLIDDFSGEYFRDVEAYLVPTQKPGAGPGRRQIIRYALDCLNPDVIIWTEPEKYSLAQFFRDIAKPILRGDADIVIPRRDDFRGYPYWQLYWELLINAWCGEAIGEGYRYDYAFGPRAFSPAAAKYFLEYPGEQKVPDAQDSIFGPLIDARCGGMRFAEVVVNFEYPAEQGRLETHDKKLMIRRAETLLAITKVMMERGGR